MLHEKNTNKLLDFFKGSIALVISNVCLKAINFFLLPLYTHNLTPEMLGISDTITGFTSLLLPLLVMGLDSAYSAFYFDPSDVLRADRVYNTIRAALAILGILPIVACIFSGDIAQKLFQSRDFAPAMSLGLVSVSFSLWALPFSLELRLQNKMVAFGVASIIASLLMILLNILFVSVLHLGAYSLILSTAIMNGIQALLLCLLVNKRPAYKYISLKLLRNMLHFALPLIPSAIMSWILTMSDRYILLYFHGETAVGIYGIGNRFITVLNIIISAVATAYTTFAFGSKDRPDAKKQFASVFGILSVLLMAIAFTIALWGKEIIQLMTASAYASAYLPLRDMMFSQLIYGMITIIGYGFLFAKKSYFVLIATSTAGVLNLILNLIFIPEYGITAAAATTLAGYIASLGVTYYASEKYYPCDYKIKRNLIVGSILYLIAYLSMELSILVKCLVWLCGATVVCLVFHNDIKRLYHFTRTAL